MKKGLTELVFILDRSGSMSGLEKDTIGGFNSLLAKQREEEGDVLISTVLFDTGMKVIHDRVSIKNIKDMTENDYHVGGCTALLDAMGKAIKHINKVQKEMPEEERPEKTMFVITTDGEENSSVEYTYDKIKKMVEKKQNKKNWEFLFLGANIDAIGAAASIGIRADRAANYVCDTVGTSTNYNALSKAVSSFRLCAPMEADAALCNWDEEINHDFSARKKKTNFHGKN